MSPIYQEAEHQELFYPNCQVARAIHVHIPSALGTLGYYVCLRVNEHEADRLNSVTTRLKVGGLRPDDLTLPCGHGVDCPSRFPSKAPGQVWRVLCRAAVSRGDGVLTLDNLPPQLKQAHLLLCTWPRFLASGQADDYLACQADPHWAPNGVPLGGIGTGKVEISRDGRFRNYSGNNNQDMPFEEPDGLDGAYLSVTLYGLGATPTDTCERVMATRPVKRHGLTLQPVPKLTAQLAFPQATLHAPDVAPGLDVTVRLAGPLTPHDPATSSLPGFVLRWTVTNRTAHTLTPVVRLAWPNLVGSGGGTSRPETHTGFGDGWYRYFEAPAGQSAKLVNGPGWRALAYSNTPSPVSASADGQQFIAIRGGLGDVSVEESPLRGSVAKDLRLAPHSSATVDMAVVWAMPHYMDVPGTDRGLYWLNQASDGVGLLNLLFGKLDAILTQGGALEQVLRGTDLPVWLQERLLNCCYPLVTNSVFYKDGRFSINEGPTEMSGVYGTLDQRLGAHAATQLLFPTLNAKELELFSALQAENGGVPHDLGAGHLERTPSEVGWPDLTCSFIIQLARHAWTTGDEAFAAAAWPRVRRALLRHAQWAQEGHGVAQVGHASGLGTSYDGYHYEGTTPYMATLWLAALKVARRWAVAQGDEALVTDIDQWDAAAVARMEADLWNGQYYRAYGSPTGRINHNCHAGMLAGEFYARLLAGSDVLSAERLDACADSWFSLNGNASFQVPPDEVSPDDEYNSEFGWLPYVESFGLAPMAVLRHSETLPLWERMIGHMSAKGTRPCDTRLMYQPLTGEISWGSYYMTAPASWLVYDALLDFTYEPGAGLLRLAPQFKGRFAVVHPRFWAIGTRTVAGGKETLSLEVKAVFGSGPLAVTTIETLAHATAISLAGVDLGAGSVTGPYRRFPCPAQSLALGTTLTWTVKS